MRRLLDGSNFGVYGIMRDALNTRKSGKKSWGLGLYIRLSKPCNANRNKDSTKVNMRGR